MNYAKKNIIELFLILLCLVGTIGGKPNYVAIVLGIFSLILLFSQQKYLGMVMGGLIGFVGAYLCLAFLSDAIKIEDFSAAKSIQFIGIGSLLCLCLLMSSILLFRKYLRKK